MAIVHFVNYKRGTQSRAVMKMKAEQGERLGGRPPYGYRKSDGDANTLVPDEDTAPVVKRIFSLCAARNGPQRIATILTKEQVVNPSNAYYRKTRKSHRGLGTTRPCLWSSNSVTSILNNEVYLGHSVGLRTTTISYKNKQRVERPESERFVVKNTHCSCVTSCRRCVSTKSASPSTWTSRTSSLDWCSARIAASRWCCTEPAR